MQLVDLLGAQSGEARSSIREPSSGANHGHDSSFKKHFDREISQRHSAKPDRGDSTAKASEKNESKTGNRADELASREKNASAPNERKPESSENTTRSEAQAREDNNSAEARVSSTSENVAATTSKKVSTDTQNEDVSSVAPAIVDTASHGLLTATAHPQVLPRYFAAETQFPEENLLASVDLDSAPSELDPQAALLTSSTASFDSKQTHLARGLGQNLIDAEGAQLPRDAAYTSLKLAAADKVGSAPSVSLATDVTGSPPPDSKALVSTTVLQAKLSANKDPNYLASASNVAMLSEDKAIFSERLAAISASSFTPAPTVAEKLSGLESASQTATSNARFMVGVQFGRAEWNSAVAQKVAQMAAQNLNFAEIQLDPPELGPLQVRVNMNHDQASVVFSSHSAQVRDALEQGQQRLRELFESEGLNLVDVDVGDQQQQQSDDELESEQAGETKLASAGSEREGSEQLVPSVSAAIQVGVDDFV